MTEIKTIVVYIGADNEEYETEAEARESIQRQKLADALEKAIAGENARPHNSVSHEAYYKLQQNISFVTYHRKAILQVLREMGVV